MSKEEDFSSPVWHPYNLASKIETDRGFDLERNDFVNLVEALRATGSIKNQLEASRVFAKLSNEDFIIRIATIARLAKLLETIQQRRHDLQSS